MNASSARTQAGLDWIVARSWYVGAGRAERDVFGENLARLVAVRPRIRAPRLAD